MAMHIHFDAVYYVREFAVIHRTFECAADYAEEKKVISMSAGLP